jgi:hypothetical protein
MFSYIHSTDIDISFFNNFILIIDARYLYLIRGFSRNTGGYFTSCECIFPSPVGTRKNASNE